MIRNIEIDGKKTCVVVLGESGLDANEYRKALLNMFEMATLWDHFGMCIENGQMWTVLKIIQAFGLPEEDDSKPKASV